MKHYHILQIARIAANLAVEHLTAEENFLSDRSDQLYRYARERQFPPAETLARKFGEMVGTPFPYSSLAEAPEHVRICFTLFRDVTAGMEPWHEDEPEDEDMSDGKPDDVEARTKAAQDEMDKVTAEHRFAPEPADETADTPAKAKKKK